MFQCAGCSKNLHYNCAENYLEQNLMEVSNKSFTDFYCVECSSKNEYDCVMPQINKKNKENINKNIKEKNELLNKISVLAFDGLTCDGSHHKQFYLSEIFKLLYNDEINNQIEKLWGIEDAIPP